MSEQPCMRPRVRRASAAVCLALIGALGVAASPALASERTLESTLNGLNQPVGVAVDNSSSGLPGELYVEEVGNSQVTKFKPNGEADGKINSSNVSGTHCSAGTPFSGAIYYNAVSASTGDLYVSDSGANTVTAFAPSGECLFQITRATPGVPGSFTPFGPAVDPSAAAHGNALSGPDGVLYVADRSIGGVDEFDADTGAFLGSFGAGQINAAADTVAVDNSGNVYVAAEATDILKFKLAGGFTEPPGVINSRSPTVVATDPSDGHVFVGETSSSYSGEYQVAEYGPNPEPGDAPLTTFGHGDGYSGYDYGIAINGIAGSSARGNVYVADYINGFVHVYGLGLVIPIVTEERASSPGYTSATVSANIDPDSARGGGPIEGCHFDYGTNATYGTSVPCLNAADEEVGTATAPITEPTAVHADLTGLSVVTTYHYRAVATDANGTTNGEDKTLATVAVLGVHTAAATNVENGNATLNGSLNPDGKATTYHFEYGMVNCAVSACTAVPIPDDGPISNSGEVSASPITIHGLKALTTYHFRIAATNGTGTTYGEDETLTTPTAVKGVSTDPATRVTLEGATLNGSLDPNGLATEYHFEYGIDTNYGQSTSPDQIAASASAGPVIGIPITGLTPHHTYHYRIVATNSVGTTIGKDQTFTTPSTPIVEAAFSSEVAASSAVIHARINPEGFDTTYHFEYGTTTSLGTDIPLTEEDIGSGETAKAVSAELSGLQSTTYYFRVSATNEWGTSRSDIQTFSFYPPNCPNAHVRQQTGAEFLPDCRAYELVSSGEAGAASISEGGWENESPYADNTYAYGAFAGIIPGAGDPPNSGTDRYVATRTPEGWLSKSSAFPQRKPATMPAPPAALMEPGSSRSKREVFLAAGVRSTSTPRSCAIARTMSWVSCQPISTLYPTETKGSTPRTLSGRCRPISTTSSSPPTASPTLKAG